MLIFIQEREEDSMDILYIGIAVAFFAASWLFVKLVARV